MRYHLAYWLLCIRNGFLRAVCGSLTDQQMAQEYIANLKLEPRYRKQIEDIERSWFQ